MPEWRSVCHHIRRHSGICRNPGARLYWTPVFIGVTSVVGQAARRLAKMRPPMQEANTHA